MVLLRTPLYALSASLNARFTAFSGWEMAVQYSGIRQEHQAVRQNAGMFDISHMGKFFLQGTNVLAQLQRLVPSDLSRLKPGAAQYTVFLNPQGGIIDDLIVYYRGTTLAGTESVVLIVNAATTEKDKAWLSTHLNSGKPSGIVFTDESRDRALIAVQGPEAIAQLQRITTENLAAVPRFGHLEGTVLGQPAFLARTGYTGEEGFEVMVSPETGQILWQTLYENGVIPCGLGARDTLRLEAAMALYGQDITEQTTPLEAGLKWLVHLDGAGDFMGREVLETQLAEGVEKRLVGLQMEGRHIARHDYPVLHGEQPIGIVTSGTLSPTLGYPIALAYVPSSLATTGQTLAVQIRGKACPAQVVKRPFYKRK
ncbi:glycine cleavage system aminomethyltransferase GcvT [Oscillatoria sp. CS-180]|uniref:glycine cleavage system aminomethyltransferase GcvT n=1 Tax=Oscillatoria sp. CS-180 TaxID=3021720 RepID=UPI00232FE8D9|nr:glycine cleavage system aminomethyltransferase GcvT [Oscillatoria sp. CS-180]MDB9524997.1 glycine cleavage system aminomethyltransferase GcvT [Oscillatoria sp. CS-180]